MIESTFFRWIRFGRSALPAALAVACMVWLSGCVTLRRYNVTDFDTVVVDAGHGGHDLGASTRVRHMRIYEKDLALDVARRLEIKLRAAGIHTVMTRRRDRFIPLDDRVAISNSQLKSVFISIHFNDTRRHSVHGVEVFHNRRGTWQLAERIERKLMSMPEGEGRGVKTARYRVLRNSMGPSLLVECGFLSNPAEAARCADPEWREHVATLLARSIIAQRRP